MSKFKAGDRVKLREVDFGFKGSLNASVVEEGLLSFGEVYTVGFDDYGLVSLKELDKILLSGRFELAEEPDKSCLWSCKLEGDFYKCETSCGKTYWVENPKDDFNHCLYCGKRIIMEAKK